MSESRKVPQSKIKYLQKNPVVSFHLPSEMRDRLRGMAAKDGVTVATYIKRFLNDLAARDDDRGRAWQQGYEAGFEVARGQYEIRYGCSVCNKPLIISPGSPCHKSIVIYLRMKGWSHKECLAVKTRYR